MRYILSVEKPNLLCKSHGKAPTSEMFSLSVKATQFRLLLLVFLPMDDEEVL